MKDVKTYLILGMAIAILVLSAILCSRKPETVTIDHTQEIEALMYEKSRVHDSLLNSRKTTDIVFMQMESLRTANATLKTALGRKPKTFTPREAMEQLASDDSLVRDQSFDSLYAVTQELVRVSEQYGKSAVEAWGKVEEERRICDARDSVSGIIIIAAKGQNKALSDSIGAIQKENKKRRLGDWAKAGILGGAITAILIAVFGK